MKVNFFATLRQVTGQKTVEFPVEPNTRIGELVDAVVTRYPDMRDDLFDENGELYPHVHIFINGRDAPYLDDAMDTIIKPTDKIDIFPAVGGG